MIIVILQIPCYYLLLSCLRIFHVEEQLRVFGCPLYWLSCFWILNEYPFSFRFQQFSTVWLQIWFWLLNGDWWFFDGKMVLWCVLRAFGVRWNGCFISLFLGILLLSIQLVVWLRGEFLFELSCGEELWFYVCCRLGTGGFLFGGLF